MAAISVVAGGRILAKESQGTGVAGSQVSPRDSILGVPSLKGVSFMKLQRGHRHARLRTHPGNSELRWGSLS